MQSVDSIDLLDTLSERVLRHQPVSAWRQVFLRPHQEVMQFSRLSGTWVCVAAQEPWGVGSGVLSDIELLAGSHGGELDACPQSVALVRFEDAGSALAMARALQDLPCDQRFQVGLASGECTLATLQLNDIELLRVMLSGAADEAEAVARMVAPGSIRLSPETMELVDEVVSVMPGCMVTTEFEGETVSATSLTFTPNFNSQLSTFAGLGLI
jgi:hypothetical protein